MRIPYDHIRQLVREMPRRSTEAQVRDCILGCCSPGLRRGAENYAVAYFRRMVA